MGLPWLPPDAQVKIEPASADEAAVEDPILEFAPYAMYRTNQTRLSEFVQLTSTAYQLAQQLLFATGRDRLPTMSIGEPRPEEWSYSMADVILQPKIIAGWLRYDEYAENEQVSLEEIRDRAQAGQLGPVKKHPSDAAPVILWPPEDRRPDDFDAPPPGTYRIDTGSFVVSVDTSDNDEFDLADPAQLEAAQQHYLQLAHALGEPAEVSQRAEAILYRAALLLEWTNFETFVRETVEALLAKHPEVIVEAAGKNASISYGDLYAFSTGFSSADDLRRELIEVEIQRLRGGGQSVHGLINFLKSQFRFKADPYQAWFVVKGQRREASYQLLMTIKERRNQLIHGTLPDSSAEIPPTEDEYLQSRLALRAIAYSIARSVQFGKYALAGEPQP